MSAKEPIDLVPMIQHRLLMDILPFADVHKFWGALSLVPCSTDVEEVLQSESNRRMQRVAPLSPVCEMYIILTADIITEAMFQRLVEAQDPDDHHSIEVARSMHPVMKKQNREVVRAALYSSLAHLLDSGFIEITKKRVA